MKLDFPICDINHNVYASWWLNFKKCFMNDAFSIGLSWDWIDKRDKLLVEHNVELELRDHRAFICGEEKDVLFFIMKYS